MTVNEASIRQTLGVQTSTCVPPCTVLTEEERAEAWQRLDVMVDRLHPDDLAAMDLADLVGDLIDRRDGASAQILRWLREQTATP